MSEIKAYIAGIVDGEGCIGLRPNRSGKTYRLFFQLAMTDKRPVDLIASTYGGRVTRYKRRGTPDRPHVQPTYLWSIYGDRCADFLSELQRLVLVKKAHVGVALDYWRVRKHITSEESKIYFDALKSLNAVGRFASEEVKDHIRLIYEAGVHND